MYYSSEQSGSPGASAPYHRSNYDMHSADNGTSYPASASASAPTSTSFLPTSTKAPRDDEPDVPPPASSSNTYQLTQMGTISQWEVPSGWKISHREFDGRMYYFEMATGKTSWSHPRAPTLPSTNGNGNRGSIAETPHSASRRPDSHQCCAVFSCIVFFPLGIPALIHSCMTYRAWSKGKYGDAYDHSRQAYNFAWWAIAIFIGYIIYRVFFGAGAPGWQFFNIFDW
mmetsp:Transcript_23135/g.35190  ORF Transcript_23135/g.35190 Transcript_23135/m.35190 type:complete len:227 (-) Transcript_23135:720-1400(-)